MKNKVVAFVPVRLNSQRVKNKSIRTISGRPMICWSLQTLDKLQIPVFVYTNYINEIKEIIDFETNNISFLERPQHLDSNDAIGLDIYKEFSKSVDSDIYLLAHCTSPFLSLETYKKCIEAVKDKKHASSLTVKKEQTFIWYTGEKLNFTLPRQKTQDVEPIFIETSAAYCYKKSVLESGSRSCDKPSLIMTEGIETIDIDEEIDLEMAQNLYKGNK